MNKVNKIAVAVSMAIGTAGLAQADEEMFSYVVSSQTVTTVLSIVNRDTEVGAAINQLHWRYFYKEGALATNNAATCQEVDFQWTSSPEDLLDVSVDEHFGSSTRGILFNDPSTNANYAPTTVSLALLAGLTLPVRAFAIVDNNDNTTPGLDGSLTAGRATILEVVNGAAWGYGGYNALNDINTATVPGPVSSYVFSEPAEIFGEVFGPAARLGVPAAVAPRTNNGVDFSFKPFNTGETTTVLFVTPVDKPGSRDADGVPNVAFAQNRGNLQVRLWLDAPGQALGRVAFDRDENPVSSRVPQNVACVGAVGVPSLMSTGAQNLLRNTGGWGRLSTAFPSVGPAPGNPYRRTDEAVILLLEHNGTGGTFNGEPINGVINNGYLLAED